MNSRPQHPVLGPHFCTALRGSHSPCCPWHHPTLAAAGAPPVSLPTGRKRGGPRKPEQGGLQGPPSCCQQGLQWKSTGGHQGVSSLPLFQTDNIYHEKENPE